jgi:hypothetical protein
MIEVVFSMFTPSQQDVRRFFCGVWHKLKTSAPLTELEAQAALWVEQHPEYDADLQDEEAAVTLEYTVEEGRTNPFLHLSMHLSLTEQVSIDQPKGIKQAFDRLSTKLGSMHEGHHQMMECLGDMIWTSQRSGLPPDGHAYLDCIKRRAR